MSVQTATNRFIVSPSQAVWTGLYQHLIGPVASFKELGNKLIRYAEQAQANRQIGRLRESAQLLTNLPSKEYQVIGDYYLAWCDYRNNIDSRETFEHVAEYAPGVYRARAMQSLAAIEGRRQDHAAELRWLIESMKIHPSAEALRGIAIVKAKEGYHESAVRDLEALHGLAQHSEPISYLQYLNSYAVELGEVGRRQEARNVSRIVLASPFAGAYQEWQETANDLRESNRPTVTINSSRHIPHNVLLMPATEPGKTAARLNEPARVLDLQKWKKKMGKGKNGSGEKTIGELNGQQMLMRIMEVYISPDTTDEQRRKIYQYALKVLSVPAKPERPDGDKAGT
jgi:tetratricopeptide (TPR) repeat protein